MSSVIWTNNAAATLAFSISDSATTATLASGAGALFPNPSAGEYFTLTLLSAISLTTREITYCTARSGDVVTIVRAQEGTTALAWNAGDLAQNLLTAASLESAFNQAVGGVLTGTLPDPGIIANLNLPGSPTTTTQASSDSSTKIATTAFANPGFGASENGYVILPSGIIFQWVQQILTNQSLTTIDFPYEFPNLCWQVTPSLGTSVPHNSNNIGVSAQPISTTQFQAVVNTSVIGTEGCYFLAVGN